MQELGSLLTPLCNSSNLGHVSPNPVLVLDLISSLPVPLVLQVICLTVLASVRIYYQYRMVKAVTRELVVRDPYALKPVRKLIDACAFRTYRHWVKKGEAQNRAALFENTCKAVLLTLAAEEELF